MINKSTFKPNWLLANRHIQTLWQTWFRRQPEILTQRERFTLPDGDFVDLDWCGYEGGPLVLVLHGVAGNLDSPYVKGILRAIADHNWCGVFMNFRGCSGEPNRSLRAYHSGETDDLHAVITELQYRYPDKPIAAIGFSMGGNVLLKYLGETGSENPLAGATAVSVPFELEKAAHHINHGIAKLYQWWLLHDLRERIIEKFEKNKNAKRAPINVEKVLEEIPNISSFLEFDNKITAPLHGFADGHDYYEKVSVRQYLKNIRKPTLLLHSDDDPFMEKNTITNLNEISPYLTFELSDSGGHVGFISGTPWSPKYWLEDRIPEFLNELFYEHAAKNRKEPA